MFISEEIKINGKISHKIQNSIVVGAKYIVQLNLDTIYGYRDFIFYSYKEYKPPITENAVAVFKVTKIKEKMKTIRVDNCQACPFVTNDNEYGYYKCNINEQIERHLKSWEELPFDKVHELCPLKKESVIVQLK